MEDGGPESGKRVDGGTEKRELPLPWAPRSGNHWEGIGGRIKRERRVSKKRGSMIGVGSDRNREDEGKAAHQTRQLPLAPLFVPPELRISSVSGVFFVLSSSSVRLSHPPLVPLAPYYTVCRPCLAFRSIYFAVHFSLSHCSKERAEFRIVKLNFLRRNLRVYFNTRLFGLVIFRNKRLDKMENI